MMPFAAILAVLLILFWPLMLAPHHLMIALIIQAFWLGVPVLWCACWRAETKRESRASAGKTRR